MDYFSVGWLIALVAFATGIGVGIIFYRFKYSDDARAQKLQEELEQVTQDFENYKIGVTDHFSKTSELVNNLTEDYVKVYKHLAEGAEGLTDVQITPQLNSPQSSPMISLINEVEVAAEASGDQSQVEPPKDYAPKEEESEGTLSESFSVGSQQKPDDLEKESA